MALSRKDIDAELARQRALLSEADGGGTSPHPGRAAQARASIAALERARQRPPNELTPAALANMRDKSTAAGDFARVKTCAQALRGNLAARVECAALAAEK